eukprot:CAMPEP_0172319464 /NCGR_PEP_ID=MMETSP1058-20130122/37718_1 /TAXON_ID=83371 /ORGANISM="Detonula confervacea, Strain CCMP 353" /LENGTH=293 /DNA_ID=CAMNT_0013034509 /DNA_START=62 /DNA_END=940 /DNA_ORIENTATION=-
MPHIGPSLTHSAATSKLVLLLFTFFVQLPHELLAFSWVSSAAHVLEHMASPPLQVTSLSDLTNTRIPGPVGSDVEILAYTATPSGGGGSDTIILFHEFFGLNPSIVEKADALAEDLGCTVVAPDTFRGLVTDFIPKAIWFALSTPQDRVNDDLDAVCSYLGLEQGGMGGAKLAIMGFCYGGGKAIRYTIQRRPDAATVVFYGAPVTDIDELGQLRAPLCGIFGDQDAQFSASLLEKFQSSLDKAGVENDVRIYEGVGHAFWTDVSQVRRGDQPQTDAYVQCTSFLSKFFSGSK